jgi:hypothetical protein
VRRHFFLPGDLERLLRQAGCEQVVTERYITVEDIDVWSDNGAIGEDRREAILEVYRHATPAFRRYHGTQLADGRIRDHMLFEAAAGVVGSGATGR